MRCRLLLVNIANYKEITLPVAILKNWSQLYLVFHPVQLQVEVNAIISKDPYLHIFKTSCVTFKLTEFP